MSKRTDIKDETMDRLGLIYSLFQKDNLLLFKSRGETIKIKVIMIYREDDSYHGYGFEGYRIHNEYEYTKVRGFFNCESKRGFIIEGWQHMA
jgi:hypothetical protein